MFPALDLFRKSALVVVDAQNGFSENCPNELPVPGALSIVEPLNRLMLMPWLKIFATQDWHPHGHSSFNTNGGPYPPHCVQYTEGANFLTGLWDCYFQAIFRKGFRQNYDAYAAGLDHPGFAEMAWGGCKDVYVAGICTNICVFETILNLRQHKPLPESCIHVVEDCCAELPLPEDHQYNPAKTRKLLEDMGVTFTTSRDIVPLI